MVHTKRPPNFSSISGLIFLQNKIRHFAPTSRREEEAGGQAEVLAKLPSVLIGGDCVDGYPEHGDQRLGKDHVHQQVVEWGPNLENKLMQISSN